ncbi:hypothetical protein [Prauserella flavalba]|uniref:Uncharacterized protein n=1 Tax=Prauserella flavalba TaxID=1477506 RepID=A0A318LJC8_9PSEU|nr:hypothetical protein [Prauserella flavalba]PXY23966.1 hypothetical protein BA062_27235 [Prauserella flavalba]
MKHRQNDYESTPAGVPEPDPPEGGPNEDENTIDPADVAPGFGGTGKTRPRSTDKEEPDR